MTETRKILEQTLAQSDAADGDVLVDMVEIERPLLFDFLFRMSGQRDAVVRVIDETVVALKQAETRWESVEAFYVGVYGTARSFCSHMWNADTSALVNDGYADFVSPKGSFTVTKDDVQAAEQAIAHMPGWEREPVLLHVRSNLSIEIIAKIMSTTDRAVEDGLNNAMLRVAQTVKQTDPAFLRACIASIPIYRPIQSSSYSTIALSQLMGDIDSAKTNYLSARNIVLLVAVVIFVLYVLLTCVG